MSISETLKTNIVSQLSWDGRVDATDIKVDVEGRTATLSGSVPTSTAKFAAVEDTLNVVGVNSVVNNISIELEDTETATDRAIRQSIRDKFSWNPDLNSFNISVVVENNWVSLEGTVDSLWKRFLAEEEAKDVLGVAGVTNKLAVADDTDITDKALAREIVNAIDRDSRVQPDTVNVEVKDRHVILSGTVYRYSAKSAAYNAAIHTPGVHKVTNNIIVDYQ